MIPIVDKLSTQKYLCNVYKIKNFNVVGTHGFFSISKETQIEKKLLMSFFSNENEFDDTLSEIKQMILGYGGDIFSKIGKATSLNYHLITRL